MSMIPLGASSCARKVISRSTEQWRIFVKTWFYLCVHFFCHGEYMKVQKTAIFTLHVALCYRNRSHSQDSGSDLPSDSQGKNSNSNSTSRGSTGASGNQGKQSKVDKVKELDLSVHVEIENDDITDDESDNQDNYSCNRMRSNITYKLHVTLMTTFDFK